MVLWTYTDWGMKTSWYACDMPWNWPRKFQDRLEKAWKKPSLRFVWTVSFQYRHLFCVCLSCFNDLKYCVEFRSRIIQGFNESDFHKSLTDADLYEFDDIKIGQIQPKTIESSSADPLVAFVDVKIESIESTLESSIEESANRVVLTSDVEATDLAECPDCLQLFTSSRITRHINEVHLDLSSMKQYSCDKCSYKSGRQSRLENHCTKFHQSSPPKTERKSQSSEIKKRKQCPTCGIFVKNLSEHQKMVHVQVKRFLCDFCNYSCYFKTKITRHIQRHIPKHLREQFPCDYQDCHFFATRKDALKSHVLTMHQTVREKVCLCIECGKSFYNKSQLNIHVKAVHEKIKNHLCNLCGKSFFNIKDMEMHVKRHGVKDMACEICGNLFYCSLDLRRHLKIHSEPTISCSADGCEKRFYTNSKLKTHIKIRHEGAKDYFCDYCRWASQTWRPWLSLTKLFLISA